MTTAACDNLRGGWDSGEPAALEPFEVPSPLPEGISPDPHTSVRAQIVFKPRSRDSFTGRNEICGHDGRGAITITGRGV